MLHCSVIGDTVYVFGSKLPGTWPVFVLNDPNVENVVSVHDFVFTSRQPQTNPSLKMSLAVFQ